MFQVGQTVVHPGEGLCVVTDIRTEEFVKGCLQEYYLLRPCGIDGGMTVYLPVNQEKIRLRTTMTAAQASSLCETAASAEPVWVENERERQEKIAAVLREGEPIALMRMVQDLRAEQAKRRAIGKKLRHADERALQDATRLLREEMAAVLKIAPSEVKL